MKITSKQLENLVRKFTKAGLKDELHIFKKNAYNTAFEEINVNTEEHIVLDTDKDNNFYQLSLYVLSYNEGLDYAGMEQISFYTNFYYHALFINDLSENYMVDSNFWNMTPVEKMADLNLLDDAATQDCEDMQNYLIAEKII